MPELAMRPVGSAIATGNVVEKGVEGCLDLEFTAVERVLRGCNLESGRWTVVKDFWILGGIGSRFLMYARAPLARRAMSTPVICGPDRVAYDS